jgi:hypothetical protein
MWETQTATTINLSGNSERNNMFRINIPLLTPLPRDRVTIDGVRIDDSIYCIFWHTTYDYILQFTLTHTLVLLVITASTSRCLVTVSNGGCFPYAEFPNYPGVSATSF